MRRACRNNLSATNQTVDSHAKVSAFFTLPKHWAEGISGKWLNIRNLAGCGTSLASFPDEAAWNSDVFHSTSMEVKLKSILDPSFRYTKSVETDLRKTFARVRRELRKQQHEECRGDDEGNAPREGS